MIEVDSSRDEVRSERNEFDSTLSVKIARTILTRLYIESRGNEMINRFVMKLRTEICEWICVWS